MNIWICIGLFLIGLSAIMIEFFLPAAGIIGIIGIAALISSIVYGYNIGIMAGTLFLLAALIGSPIILIIAFKIFPYTFFGKKLILNDNQSAEKGFSSHLKDKYDDLLGREGISYTALRPTGMIKIEDKKFNGQTGGDYIEKNEKVKIIKVTGNKITVKKLK